MTKLSDIENAVKMKSNIAGLLIQIDQVERSQQFNIGSGPIAGYIAVGKESSVLKIKNIMLSSLRSRVMKIRADLREMGFDPDK